MQILSIDIETFSDVDLIKSGVYAYTTSPAFQILLFAYAFDDEPIKIIDLASGETLSIDIISAIKDDNITKTAFNAMFERICLSKHLGAQFSPVGWSCTVVQSAMLGLPLSLAGVAKILGLEQQKMSEGKALIRYFSIHCKPTAANENRERNLPHHAPNKWQTFKDYCIQDVEVERSIRAKIAKYPISETEQNYYILDQQINDRGVMVDLQLVNNAIRCDELFKEKSTAKAVSLTGLDNPNSAAQLKQWLSINNRRLIR